MYHEHERDTLAFSHQLYTDTPRHLAFQATTLTEAKAWQQELRAKLIELVGGFPEEPCDLESAVLESSEFPTYFRETVQFKSRPHMAVFGYLLTPKHLNGSAPNPAILCLAGHGRGVE